jgi:hypothetical protein
LGLEGDESLALNNSRGGDERMMAKYVKMCGLALREVLEKVQFSHSRSV